MRGHLVQLIFIMFLFPATIGVLAMPVVDIDTPSEGEVVNSRVFTVTGTASGSQSTLLETTEANFLPGIHDSTTATASGEVVIFPMPSLAKQNNGDPVFVKGAGGEFDDDSVSGTGVALDGGTYHMWYTGNDENNNRIGYATSPDGITWTRMNGGIPVLDRGDVNDFDSFGVFDPWVMNEGGTWKMWYSASDGLNRRIGYATSADGISWSKQSTAVLDLGAWNKFDEDGVSSPTIVKVGTTYHMFYIGTKDGDSLLGYATSTDGTHWTRQNNGNTVMQTGNPGSYDGAHILSPSVLYLNGVFKLYYTGDSGSTKSIALAISGDGVTWVKQNDNQPVLVGTNGKFDWKSVHGPMVVQEGLVERMWYSGVNSTTTSIGYATATISSVSGIYTSPPFEFGGNVEFETINWTVETPSGTTAAIEARTETRGQSWGSWFTPSNGGALGAPDGWRFQYKVTLTSDDISKTPAFKDLTLKYYSPVVKVEASSTGSLWYTCTGTDSWTCEIMANDGPQTIRARSIDSTGTHSFLSYVNITMNGDIPLGTIKVNDGDLYANSRDVTLTLNASDSSGIGSMMLSEAQDFTGAVWEPYVTNKVFTLSEGDGWKNVHAKFRDAYGIESTPTNDSVLLDTTPPNGTIVIDSGATFTTDREVVLKLSAKDKNGIAGMIVSEDPTFSGLSPGTFYESEFFTLSDRDGDKTVHVRYVDNAGNNGDFSATITLDTTAPTGTLRINSNAAVTITRMVNLTIDGKDKSGLTHMMFSNSDDFGNSSWEPFREYRIWELVPGSGEKVVFVKLKDMAGLESKAFSDNIVLEEPGDEGIIVINEGEDYTNDRNVSLTFGISDLGTVTDMMVSNNNTFDGAEWMIFEERLAWELGEGNGLKTVYVKFLTMAGIETEAFKDNITLDLGPPEVAFLQPTNGTTTKVSDVSLVIRASDTIGLDKVEVLLDGEVVGEASRNATDPSRWELEISVLGKGAHEVKVVAMDKAGNTAEDVMTVHFKPKKKQDSPFLDGGLVVVAIGLSLAIVLGRRRRGR